MKQAPRRKARPPWASADYDIADVAAIQALDTGTATPDQQKRGLKWIVEGAAQVGDDAFIPGHPETSQYLMGRQSVGKQVIKLMKIDKNTMRSPKT